MEDLQGTIEVVVFPRLYEQTAGTWREGEILLVAGRVDHKGEDISLLADLAVDWDAAAGAGRGRLRAAGRGGRARRRTPRAGGRGGNGNGHGNGYSPARGRWSRSDRGRRAPVGAGAAGMGAVAGAGGSSAPAVPFVSPRRGGGVRSRRHADVALPSDRAGRAGLDLPATCRARPAAPTRTTSRRCPTRPAPGSSPTPARTRRSTPVPARCSTCGSRAAPRRTASSARWRRSSPSCATGPGRPGSSSTSPRPAAGRPCRWSSGAGVAYDAELLAEVRRRLGDGLVDLRLGLTGRGSGAAA